MVKYTELAKAGDDANLGTRSTSSNGVLDRADDLIASARWKG